MAIVSKTDFMPRGAAVTDRLIWITTALAVVAVACVAAIISYQHASVTGEPDAADVDAVKAGLVEFNTRAVGFDKAVPMAVFARRDGVLVGGAVGFTHWE
jgi:hypothetical protein